MIPRYTRDKMGVIWTQTASYDRWLLIEKAACKAWSDEGLIPKTDLEKLSKATYDISILDEVLKDTKHPMTAFLKSMTDHLGEEGRWLHHGLTTSDVWDTATAMQLRDSADLLLTEVDSLIEVLYLKASKYKNTLMMGRTHGVHAEPITFGQKIAIWWDEMRRHRSRLVDAKDMISVGKLSGPVGTHATVPPSIENSVCKQLGLEVAPFSNQVIQRDRHAQFVTTLAQIAGSLEKFSTEIRGLQRTEIREVEEPFGVGQTGSSSMPHKRNPELTERICGLARLIRGYAVTSMENVALWHERDISHSSNERIILPDSCIALDYILDLMTHVISNMTVHVDRMKSNLEESHGVVFSQRLLLSLVEAGSKRETAYKIVQRISQRALDENLELYDLVSQESEVVNALGADRLQEIFDYNHYIRHIDETFKNAGIK
ncbi:MAG: adenylosuccinate lyase [Dehalococcoidia bacterium]|nr:adenylosuccinate lyase [Dehalococcoidia bacterium]